MRPRNAAMAAGPGSCRALLLAQRFRLKQGLKSLPASFPLRSKSCTSKTRTALAIKAPAASAPATTAAAREVFRKSREKFATGSWMRVLMVPPSRWAAPATLTGGPAQKFHPLLRGVLRLEQRIPIRAIRVDGNGGGVMADDPGVTE